MDYEEFLRSKRIEVKPCGFTIDPSDLNSNLFDFQRDIVAWSLKKGRSCMFLSTGLGKSICQLTWSQEVYNHTDNKVLILAPLAVADQTVREGAKFNIPVNICESQSDMVSGINITNYEKLHKFDCSEFGGIVLDESSILKHFEGKFRTEIIKSFRDTPYKLACTATPSPNDTIELLNHAEFMGVMKRAEALSQFFVHEGKETQKWRLKGHAIKAFWEWVASWAVMMQLPSDLGYEDRGFKLPPLNIEQLMVGEDSSYQVREARTLQEQREARRTSLPDRVSKAAELINNSGETWICWCNLNDESEALTKAIPDAVEVKGSDKPELKAERLLGFANGKHRVLVSKSSIAGFGLNFQVCHNQVFVGIDHSFEGYFQAVRRCWRFGQTHPVNVYIITSRSEGAVVKNIQRKEDAHSEMMKSMIAQTQEITKQNIRATEQSSDLYYPTVKMTIPDWLHSEPLEA